jgi:hypothetical protein
MTATNQWPDLPLAEWKDNYDTLHRWTEIVSKIRLALTPLENHWWYTTLYVRPCGLRTSTMSYKGLLFQIEFDFIAQLLMRSCCLSCRAPMRRQQQVPSGIDVHRSVSNWHIDISLFAQAAHRRIMILPPRQRIEIQEYRCV